MADEINYLRPRDDPYGYGNPEQARTDAHNMLGEKPGSGWALPYLNPTVARFLSEALATAPMAFPAARASLPPRWEKTYHGTADPAFKLQDKPIWSTKNEQVARYFASEGPGEPGAIAPLQINTADYVNVPKGGLLEKVDNKIGSANQLNDGRNWLADILRGLGKRGLRYERLERDQAPVVLSLDPRTVRSDVGGTPSRGGKK